MKLNLNYVWKSILTRTFTISNAIFLCILMMIFAISSCRKQPQSALPLEPPPPDISDCTHIELRYSPSKLEYFIHNQGLFSPEEVNDVESLIPTIIDDPEFINALAHDVKQGTFHGYYEGRLAIKYSINIIGYQNDEFKTAFLKSCNYIHTGSKTYIYENEVWPSLEKLKSQSLTAKIKPLGLRNKCAANIALLRSFIIEDPLTQRKQYPVPSEWCDILLRRYPPGGTEQFKCPSAGEGKSHYAINPNCRPDSPADMVLIFETTDGWNQHGGPELFTFDNHDPKGGCVLLNDGTVKFIRTKEELQQLRWK
jgi:hypothetical protein